MRAAHWLIGCVLCIAGSGTAAATSAGAQGLDGSARTVIDNSSQHDSSGSGGDVLGPTHDCTPTSGSDSSGNTSSNGNDHSGGASSAPASTRRPHLGWQSLLPGSIQ